MMMHRLAGPIGVLALALMLPTQTANAKRAHTQTANAEANTASQIDGVWQSQSYSRVLEISDGRYRVLETTGISCLEASTGPLSDFTLRHDAVNQTLSILEGYDDYRHRRIARLPATCRAPKTSGASTDPLRNFDVFAQTVEENFAYFDLTEANWQSLRRETRAGLSSTSGPAELLSAMERVLEVLGDNHGEVIVPDGAIPQDTSAEAVDAGEAAGNTPKEYGDFEIARLVAEHHLQTDMTKASRLIKWGQLSGSTGYLQINIMTLYARFPELADRIAQVGLMKVYLEQIEVMSSAERLEREIAGIASVMDRAMEDLARFDRIVLDLRFNGGGFDEIGLEALKRFNDQPRYIASKIACTDRGCTRPLAIQLGAAAQPYTRPVLLLVSPQTGSAAEMFTLSAQALPNVTLAGGATMGALSDALERRLPNGWSFTISNEVYFDTQLRSFESKGVPVAIELGYARDRQTFFRAVADDLDADKAVILRALKRAFPATK